MEIDIKLEIDIKMEINIFTDGNKSKIKINHFNTELHTTLPPTPPQTHAHIDTLDYVFGYILQPRALFHFRLIYQEFVEVLLKLPPTSTLPFILLGSIN